MTGRRRGRRWSLLLLVGAVWGTYTGSVQQAVHGLWGRPWNWADLGLHVVGWAVPAPPLLWLLTRLLKRPAAQLRARQDELVHDAMVSGSLPPDVAPGPWRRALQAEVKDWHGQVWVFLVSGLLAGGLVGFAAVRANGNDWRVWAVAVVMLAAGVLGARWSTRRLRTARSLLAQLPVT